MRRRFIRIGVSTAMASALLLVLWSGFSSSPPSGWMNLHVDDGRIDIIKLVGLPDADMRDLKGYDAWHSASARFLGATGYWHMLLTYDPGDRLSTRHVSFVPFESGGANDWIPERVLHRIKGAYSKRTP